MRLLNAYSAAVGLNVANAELRPL